VKSDADARAPHVDLADEAVRIGPPPAVESYLRIPGILDAAKRTGADAIHPGYGFLSESATFAKGCVDAQLAWIGPPAEVILAMGNKAGAKQRMAAAGVPTVPGYLGDDQTPERFEAEAERLGLPLLVKAVAGGGGRGIRLVRTTSELSAAILGARREAESAFGDGRLMLERLIENGRHVEMQIFADNHGNAIFLGERDCSVQRRRQKIIEEAPSPLVSPSLRQRMGRAAVTAALAVGYRGAGTIEFMAAPARATASTRAASEDPLEYFFLEMNTRLQVEHPVTELVTGLDLVEWQLRIAAGEPLPLRQGEVQLAGHAIEARLYAEDPYRGFVPQTGAIAYWRPERARGAAVRIDDGIREGGEVSPFYDAMVAKFIAHGRSREDAIRRLRLALERAPLLGVVNNGSFLRDLLAHAAFRGNAMTTDSLDRWLEAGDALLKPAEAPLEAWWMAAAALVGGVSGLRSRSVEAFDLRVEHGGEQRSFRVERRGDGVLLLQQFDYQARARLVALEEGDLCVELDGVRRHAVACWVASELHLAIHGRVCVFREACAWPLEAGGRGDPSWLLAPVAGVVARVLVVPGARVVAGQNLISVEAMKMEMWVAAAANGTVKTVSAPVGTQVQAEAPLIQLELE